MVEIKWQIQSHSTDSQGHSLCFRSHWTLRRNSSSTDRQRNPVKGPCNLQGLCSLGFQPLFFLKMNKLDKSEQYPEGIMHFKILPSWKWGPQKGQCFTENSVEKMCPGKWDYFFDVDSICGHLGWEFQGEVVHFLHVTLSEESQGREGYFWGQKQGIVQQVTGEFKAGRKRKVKKKEAGNSLHLHHGLSRDEGMTKKAVTFLLSLLTHSLLMMHRAWELSAGRQNALYPCSPSRPFAISSLHILRAVALSQEFWRPWIHKAGWGCSVCTYPALERTGTCLVFGL